ncbi:MAG: hypothetical protein J5757_05285 [Lachnospiraceae bacterium]|nr:hypothetical protein [Lachnospiraceae bacterium]
MGYGTISSIGKRRRRHMDVTLELACVAVIVMAILVAVDAEFFFFLFCPLFLISGWVTLYRSLFSEATGRERQRQRLHRMIGGVTSVLLFLLAIVSAVLTLKGRG